MCCVCFSSHCLSADMCNGFVDGDGIVFAPYKRGEAAERGTLHCIDKDRSLESVGCSFLPKSAELIVCLVDRLSSFFPLRPIRASVVKSAPERACLV